MSEPATNGHNPQSRFLTQSVRDKSKSLRDSLRATLTQAATLKDLAFEVALKMRESFGTEEEADRARCQAQAVTSCIKGWSETLEAIRIARNKPLPGSRRPLPEQPKVKKKNLPKVQLAEAGEVQERPACGSQPQAVVATPAPPTSTDSTVEPQAGK